MDMTIIRTMTIAAALAVCAPAVQVRADAAVGPESFPVSSAAGRTTMVSPSFLMSAPR